MSSLRKNRGTIVGELLAQVNLAAIAAAPKGAWPPPHPIHFRHDPLSPFSKEPPPNPVGYRHHTVNGDGDIDEAWYYDRGFTKACGVTVHLSRAREFFHLKLELPTGEISLSLHPQVGVIGFAGYSRLSGMSGEFSGFIRASITTNCSEYLLEYSDLEVNTFSETLTVDDRSGEIVGIDSAESDQDDRQQIHPATRPEPRRRNDADLDQAGP